MDNSDWIMLKTISEERSLTKTAERLYISQPSLTYRLNKLEKEFGVTILNRHSNGVSFTIPGEYILKYAEEMLERYKLLKNNIQDLKEPIWGTIQLGISSTFARFKIAPILKTYHNRFPDVKIVLKIGSSTLQLPDMLRDGVVDVIIQRGDIDWPEKKHTLSVEPYGIISSQPIEINDLPSIPWIQDQSNLITKSDKVFYSWWDSHFSCPPPQNIIEVNSLEACIQLVSQGLGWTVLPKIHVSNQRSLFFHPLILPMGQPIIRKTIMAYKNESLEKPEVRMFVDYVLNEFTK